MDSVRSGMVVVIVRKHAAMTPSSFLHVRCILGEVRQCLTHRPATDLELVCDIPFDDSIARL
jgi:hypothetical protein